MAYKVFHIYDVKVLFQFQFFMSKSSIYEMQVLWENDDSDKKK